MTEEAFADKLRSALALDLPHEYRARPGSELERRSREAAVLVLFAETVGGLSILLTRRSEDVASHKGQMAFPGGVCDAEDAASFETTALRETEEEVGISRRVVRTLGTLPDLVTTTGYKVIPVVGLLTEPAESVKLATNPAEIAEAFWTPLDVLLSPENFRMELFPVGAVQYPIHVFQIGPHRVWGATASILKNLLDRLRALD